MSADWSSVRLGDVLTLQRRWLTPELDRQYVEIGVRSFGRGVFHKAPVTGADLGNKRVLRIEPGDLVLMNVFAWEGAVAVAGPEEAGIIGSHRYATYTMDADRYCPEFLNLYFKTGEGRDLLARVSPGSAGRNRTLNLARFSEQMVSLPPLEEQRRIVTRVGAIAAKVEEAQRLRRAAEEESAACKRSELGALFRQEGPTRFGDFATVQNGYAFKSEWFVANGVRLARNANVGHGELVWSDVAYLDKDRRHEFQRFELSNGDILVSLDRPLISTGVKAARVRSSDLPALLLQRVGRIQLKSPEGLLPDYVFGWLRSPAFAESIDPGRSNGVPHISSKDIEGLPFSPPSPRYQELAIRLSETLQNRIVELGATQRRTRSEIDAVIPVVLDRAFRGGL